MFHIIITTIFVVSAGLPLAVVAWRQKSSPRWMLLISTVLYFAFCALATARLCGIVPTQSIEQIVHQQGFDPRSVPVSVGALVHSGLIALIGLNLLSAFWIWRGLGFWSWFLTCVVIFFVVGGVVGIVLGLSPIYVWFGVCCGIMAMVGWVLGFSYIEFCVIGNIWLHALAIIASAIYMMAKVRNRQLLFKTLCFCWGIGQIAVMLILLFHYWGSMDYAFYLCVHDLRTLAATCHTTYQIINIIVYFPLFILPLQINLAISHISNLSKT